VRVRRARRLQPLGGARQRVHGGRGRGDQRRGRAQLVRDDAAPDRRGDAGGSRQGRAGGLQSAGRLGADAARVRRFMRRPGRAATEDGARRAGGATAERQRAPASAFSSRRSSLISSRSLAAYSKRSSSAAANISSSSVTASFS